MRKLLPRLSVGLLSAVFFALAVFADMDAAAQAPDGGRRRKTELFKGREAAAGQVLVKFRESALPHELEGARAAADVEHERKVGGGAVRLLRSRSKNVEALVRELSSHPDVVYAEPNFIIRPSAVPGDPRFGDQWALQNTGYAPSTGAGTPGADIGAASAWDVSTGSRDNVIAVMDTGIDSTHPDLAANMWTAPAPFTVEIGGQTIRCEAGTHGFNAITKTCDPADEYDHGTHVAGIVGASGGNGVGGAGVNWTTAVMDIKFIDATGSGTLSDAIDAIEFAIQARRALGAAANVRVLNASWGWNGEASQALLDEINRAGDNDMLFVAGAGNGGEDRAGDDNDLSPFYPASYDAPNLVAVAATDNNDAPASFSNYSATRVHLGAPGVLVLSTVKGGGYDFWSGTSMATPHVSGAAALVLSRCALDTAGLKSNLLSSVDHIPSLSGLTATGGRLDAGTAIRSCAPPAPTPTPTPIPTPTPVPTPTPTPTPARLNAALASNGGVATASSTTTQQELPGMDFSPAGAIDGDRKGLNWEHGGGWRDATNNVYPDWLQVDFAAATAVNEISVFSLQDGYASPAEPTEALTFTRYGVTVFNVQYWDGAQWVTAPGGAVTNNGNVWRKFTFPAVTTTKVRVVVNNALAGRSRLVEVEAWGTRVAQPPPPSGRVNHAAASNGGVATASSTTTQAEFPGLDFSPAGVINGDRRGLNWEHGGGWRDGTNAFPDWVQVEFPAARKVDEVSVFSLQDNYASPSEPTEALTFTQYGVTSFEVQFWDGSKWLTVPGGVVTNNGNVWRKVTFPQVTTTKVRVVVNNALGGRSRVVEVEARGPAS